MLKSDDYSDERRFSDGRRNSLIKQINNWLGDMIRNKQLPSRGSYELGEQFLMACFNNVEFHSLNSLDRDLGGLVELTDRRHHQLKWDKKPVAYARSRIDQNDSLCQLFATTLAAKVQAAITWLDEHENELPDFATATWLVRLVTIPTYHAHAFLIQKMQNGPDAPVGDSYVLMISAPPWLEKLQGKELLTSRAFLQGFQDKNPIIGLREGESQT